MQRRSLRAIAILYVALILAAMFAVRTATYATAHHALNREVDRRLDAEAIEIAGMHADVPLPQMIARIDAEERDHESADLYFMLRDRAGRQVAGRLRLPRSPPPGYSDFDETADVAGVGHGRALARRVADGATLVIVSDNDVVDQFDALLSRVQLVGFGFAMLIVTAGAAGILWEVSRRLRAMQRTVDAVMAGDFASRIPLSGSHNEFDRQAAAFNAMLDRIAALMSNVKHAAKDVAHELKSPLARLRGRIAALARHAEGHPLAPDIAGALTETDQLLDLFASLMRLWEVEGGHRRERFVALDLAALTQEIGEALAPVAEDAGHSLTIVIPATLPFRGERNLLRQLLVNLVENAIRHTPPGTRIVLSTGQAGGCARILVEDDGPGIPAAQHEAVIRRFGRLDPAEEAPGHGIGLTLIDAIARLHDGALRLEDAAPGLRAVVELPLTP